MNGDNCSEFGDTTHPRGKVDRDVLLPPLFINRAGGPTVLAFRRDQPGLLAAAVILLSLSEYDQPHGLYHLLGASRHQG